MRVTWPLFALCAALSCGCGFFGTEPGSPPPPENTDPPRVVSFRPSTGENPVAEPVAGQWRVYASAPGAPLRIHAVLEGPGLTYPPTTFAWDWGGAAVPSTATTGDQFETASFMFPTPGTYSGSITASNRHGTTTYNFTTVVEPPPAPIMGEQARGPHSATVGVELLLSDYVSSETQLNWNQGPTFSWRWEFSGGVTPAVVVGTGESSSIRVLLQSPGNYEGTVTVTSAGGSDTYEFRYAVVQP
jgi:hypothetical protein